MAGWGRALLDLALPPGCVACGGWLPGGGRGRLVCGPCLTRLPVAPWPRCPRCDHPRGTGRVEAPGCRACDDWPAALTRARHAHLLSAPADALVHALKYGGWAELAGVMGRAMAGVTLPALPAGESRVVVAMPTTPSRERERGYNQAYLLARQVADSLRLPLVQGLRRERGGVTQVALHPSQRRANVKGVFAVRNEALSRLRGAHVLLVDDVLTTGATAGSAATVLARAGVSEVTLLTYARALPFHRRADV